MVRISYKDGLAKSTGGMLTTLVPYNELPSKGSDKNIVQLTTISAFNQFPYYYTFGLQTIQNFQINIVSAEFAI